MLFKCSFRKNGWHERGCNERLGGPTTNRLRVWNLVSKQTVQQTAERVDLRIGEVNPLFDESLLFEGSAQQHRGVRVAAADNW
jgi:hypothetical protein